MRLLIFFFLFLLSHTTAWAQQSIQYEMKLLRVYQNYPHNDPGGPDITWKVGGIINGLGVNPIPGNAELHLPNMQSTGWFDAGGHTIVSGTIPYDAGNTFNLCSDNITVRLELEGWEDDFGNVFEFTNSRDDHRFGAFANAVGNAKINPGSGITRVFELINFSTGFQNPYYGFEVSVTYTLTNGLSEAIYAGDINGGPLVDVCEDGSYFVFARTGPGFSGGFFEFQRSDNGGSTWTTVQMSTSPAYRVTATFNPSVLYRVRLRGGFGCLGYGNDDGWVTPAGANNLRILPIFDAAAVNYSVEPSCSSDENGSITVSSVDNLPAGTPITMQLSSVDDPFFIIPGANANLVTPPHTWSGLAPGRYKINVTQVSLNGENLPAGQCTRDIPVTIEPIALPSFTAVLPNAPACGGTLGSVTAIVSNFNAGSVHNWEVFAVGNPSTAVASSTTQASTVEIGGLAPGDYYIRLTLSGICSVDSDLFTVASPPAATSGSVQVVPQGATDVLCLGDRTSVNFNVGATSGQNTVRVYFSSALNNVLVSGAASPGTPFSAQLLQGNYTAIFQREDSGCEASVNFTVTGPASGLEATVSATTAATACMPMGGELTLSISNGAAPYNFVIAGEVKTPASVSGSTYSFTGLSAGNGTYLVADANGCETSGSYSIAGSSNISINVPSFPSVPRTTCNGGSDAWLSFWFEGGTAPYTYRVEGLDTEYIGPIGGFISNAIVRPNLPPGTYTIYVRDADNCEESTTIVYEERPEIRINQVEIGPASVCNAGFRNVKLYVTGLSRFDLFGSPWQQTITYGSLSGGPTNFSPSQVLEDPNDPDGVILDIGLHGGNRTFQVRQDKDNPGGTYLGVPLNVEGYCFSNVVSVPSTAFSPAPQVAITTDFVSPTCPGETNGSFTVNYTGGEPGYELQLIQFATRFPISNPTTRGTVVLENSGAGSHTFTGLAAGFYGVQIRTAITDGGAGSLPSSCTFRFPNWDLSLFISPYTLTEPNPISINTITTTVPLQCDLTGGQISVQSVSGGTPPYEYSIDGVNYSSSNLLPAISQNTIYVRDANFCEAAVSYLVEDIVPSSLSINFTPDPPIDCILQGLGTFTITPGASPYTIAYSADAFFEPTFDLIDPVIIYTSNTSVSVSGLIPGTYYVRVTDADQCTFFGNFNVPQASAPPIEAFTSAKTQQSCPDTNDGALTVTVQGGTPPYQITYDGISNTGASLSLNNLGPSTYAFDITDAAGCTYTHEESIEAATVIRHDQSYTAVGPCLDSGNGSVTISPEGGQAPYTITWEDGTPSQTVGLGGDFIRNQLNREEYTFTITDASGCFLVSSVYPPGPDTQFELSLGTVVQASCSGTADGSVSLNASGGTAPYTFSSDGGNSFQSSATFSGLGSGTYSFIARDASGCEQVVGGVQINNDTDLSASTTTVPPSCGGEASGSITVVPSGGVPPYMYRLSGGIFTTNNLITGLSAGTYNLEVQDANGCVAFVNGVVVAEPLPISIQLLTTSPDYCGQANGSATVSATGGTATLTYLWADGQAGPTATGLAAGNTSVTVRDGNNCTNSLVVSIPAIAGPTISGISGQDAICSNNNGSATVSFSGGTGMLTVSWSNGATGASIFNLSGGTYTATVTDSEGCSTSQSIAINFVEPPTVSTTQTAENCGQGDGSITVNASGGSGSYSYAWPAGVGSTTNFADNLSGGTYVITVTDDVLGCVVPTIVNLLSTTALEATFSTTDVLCNGQNGGSIVAVPSSGTAPYSIAVNGNPLVEGLSVTGLAAGTYSVTLRDFNGCSIIAPAIVINEPAPLTLNAQALATTCAAGTDGAILLLASGGTGSFVYRLAGGTYSGSSAISGLSAGVYTVQVRDANGCETTLSGVEVTEPSPIVVSVEAITPSFCGRNDGTITVNATGGTGTLTYVWSDGQSGPIASGLAAGTYSVTVSDVNNCSLVLENLIVPEEAGVDASVTEVQNSLCEEGNGRIVVSVSGGAAPLSYTWSHDATLNSPIAENLSSGDYTLTVTDANNCSTSVSATVLLRSSPVLSIISVSPAACMGNTGEIVLGIESGGSGPFQYAWSHDAALNASTASGLSTGNYSCTVTDFYGCTDEISAFVGELPPPTVSISTTASRCSAANGSAAATVLGGTPPYQYTWSNGQTAGPTVGDLLAGDYSLTVTDFFGCEAIEQFTIGDIAGPSALGISFQNSLCNNNSGSISVSPVGGTLPYTYQWSHNPLLNQPNAVFLPAGEYTITVIDANGCSISATQTIEAELRPVLEVVEQRNSFCTNDNGRIEIAATGTAPFVYTWSVGGFSGPSAENLAAGNYTVSVTDANNCVTARSFVISFIPAPVIVLSDLEDDFCNAGAGLIVVDILLGTPPFTYTWSHDPALNANTASDLLAGVYDLTVTDANNCVAEASYTLAGAPDLVLTVQDTDPAFCGEAVGAVYLQVGGGLPPYTIVWDHDASLDGTTAVNLLPGDYTASVTDANGCMTSVLATVLGTPLPVLSLVSNTDNPCVAEDVEILVAVSSGVGPYIYSWSDDANRNSPFAGGLSSGTYTVSVTDANGCTAELSVTAVDDVSPILTLLSTAPSSCDVANGSASVEATLGQLPYTYSWSHEAALNSPTATGLAAGDYEVTVTDANGCSASISLTIENTPFPVLSLVSNTDNPCVTGDVEIEVAASSGVGPYTYSWSDDANRSSPFAGGLSSGIYTVIVTDANGCTAELSVTALDDVSPILTLLSTSPSSCDVANGSASVEATLGQLPYTYSWSHDAALNAPTATGLAAGDYEVTVTDANGCFASTALTIENTPSPVLSLVSNTNNPCLTEDVEIEVAVSSGVGPYTYTWSDDASRNSPFAGGLSSGTYTVTVTDANGCTAELSVTAVDDVSPILILLSTAPSSCDVANGSASVEATLGQLPYTYSWSHEAALNASTATGLAAGDYEVTVTDANGCSASISLTIENTPFPVLSLVSNTDNPCVTGDVEIEVAVSSGVGPYTYTWSDDANRNSPFAGGLSSGIYTVIVTDANGCTAELSVTALDDVSPILTLLSTSPSSCDVANGSASVEATLGQLPYTYSWSHDAALNAPTATGLAAGDYEVTVTDANGCFASTALTIENTPSPVLSLVSNTDNPCVTGDVAILVAVSSGVGPYTYSWSDDASRNSPFAGGLSSGTYTVTVTDVNGCTAELSVTAVDDVSPILTLLSSSPSSCEITNGSATVAATLGQPPYTYSWSHDPMLNEPTATGLAAGRYDVVVTDANGCSATIRINISDVDGPAVLIGSQENAICSNDNGSIELSVSAGEAPYTYRWSHEENLDLPIATGLSAGDYSVTVTDAFGCQGIVTTNLNFIAPPTTTVLITDAICNEGTGLIDILVAGGTTPYTIDWDDASLQGFGVNSINSGNYTVTVTDASNCTLVLPITVEYLPSPTVELVSQTLVSCDLADGELVVGQTGGQAPFRYSWSHDPDLETNVASGLSAGTYEVSVTDANFCVGTLLVNLADVPSFTVNEPMVVAATCGGENGQITLTIDGGQAPFEYEWSHDASLNSPIASGLSAGTYHLSVSDNSGCTRILQIEVPGLEEPALSLLNTEMSSCNIDNGSISVEASSGLPPYSYQWSHTDTLNDPTASNLSPGSYTVMVSDANGCSASLEVSITTAALPLLSLDSISDDPCVGNDVALLVAVTNGLAPYNYAWSDDATRNSALATGLSSGTYILTLTDANGCEAQLSVSVEEEVGPELNLVDIVPSACDQPNGMATVETTLGQPPYSYTWSHDAQLDSPVADGLAAGIYTVTLSDAAGCTQSLEIEIPNAAAPTLSLLSVENPSCDIDNGSIAVAVDGGQPPYTYNWSNGQETANVEGLGGGTYQLTVTDALGCQALLSTTLTPGSSPTLQLVENNPTGCGAGTGGLVLSGAGGTAPYTYSWSHDPTINGATATGLEAGTYTLVLTDAAACTTSITATVEAITDLSVSLLQNQPTICTAATGAASVLAAGGQPPYIYSWSHDVGLQGPDATGLSAGSYSLTITDAGNCAVELSFTVETEEQALEISILDNTASDCDNATGSLALSTTGGLPPYTYTWSHDSDLQIANAEGLAAGSYTIVVSDANGCTTTLLATIANLGIGEISVSTTPAWCGQASGTASLTSSATDLSFQWENTASPGVIIAQTASVENLLQGLYRVSITNTAGCQTIQVVEITEVPAIVVNANATSNLCYGEATASAEVAILSGGTSPFSVTWSNGANSNEINNLSAGNYQFTVSDANGCTYSDEVVISQPDTLSLAVLSVAPPLCALGATGSLSVMATGGVGPYEYQWATGQQSSAISNLDAGDYSLTITDANGCVAQQSFSLEAPAAIQLALSSTPACSNDPNGTALAVASGGSGMLTYLWSNGATESTLTDLLPGLFTVSVTDENGCTRTASTLVGTAAFPTLSVEAVLQPNCTDQLAGQITVAATGGTGAISYLWNDPAAQTSQTAVGLSPGTYSVTATDENACAATTAVLIEAPADFELSAGIITSPTCFGAANGSASVAVQGGSGNFAYQWDDPLAQTLAQTQNLPAGNYTVIVTDLASGCEDSLELNIQDPPVLELSLVAVEPINCFGDNSGTATVAATGGTGAYTYTWNDPANQTGPIATGLAAGDYQLSCTDANGCSAIIDVSIESPPALLASISDFNAPLCFGENSGSASVVANGGSGAYTYQWNDPAMQSGALANGLTAGDYTVVVSDENGCTTEASVSLPATPEISISLAEQVAPICEGEENGRLAILASGGTGTLQYLWSNGDTTASSQNLTAGNYSVSVSDENNCSVVLELTLDPAPMLSLEVVEIIAPVCAAENTGSIQVVAAGGNSDFTYAWASGQTGAQLSNLAGGISYQVTATNAAGCTEVLSVDLPAGSEVDLQSIPSDTTLCADDILELDLSDFVSSTVTGPAGFSNSAPTVLFDSPGTYSIAVEDMLGCRDTAMLAINYTANTLIAGMVLPSDVVVGDSVVVLETSWPAPDTVIWDFDQSRASLLRQQQNQYWFRFDEPGRYFLRMAARQGGCEDIIGKEIIVHADSSSIPSIYLGALKILNATISPNPNTGQFQLAVDLSGIHPIFINLYDAGGMPVERRQGEGQAAYTFNFDLQGQTGNYVLLVQTAQDRRAFVVIVQN